MSKTSAELFAKLGKTGADGLAAIALSGKERFLLLRALAAVRSAVLGEDEALASLNHDVFDGKTALPAAIIGACRTLPMMAPRRLVEVHAIDAMSADVQSELIPYLDAPDPQTTLVLVAEKADLRTKLFTALSKRGWLYLFDPPKERELAGFIEREVGRRGSKVTRSAASLLAELIGADLGQLSESIEKLCLSVGQEQGAAITDADVESLVRQTKSHSVFDFARAVSERDTAGALDLLGRLLRQKESPIAMVALLERQLRLLLVAKEHLEKGGRRAELPSKLGVPPFVADAMFRQLGLWSAAALERGLSALYRCDKELKSSKLDGPIEMTRLVLSLGQASGPQVA